MAQSERETLNLEKRRQQAELKSPQEPALQTREHFLPGFGREMP
jgi:hypothetical protein